MVRPSAPAVLLAPVVVISGLAATVIASPTLAVLPPALVGWACHARLRALRRRRSIRAEKCAIAAVDTLIQDLKAGGSLGATLRRNQSMTEAVVGSPDGRLVEATLGVLVQRGGRAVPSLERLNDTLRSAHALRAEVVAQAGQATASASLMAALPAVFVAALALADERLWAFYLYRPTGTACLLTSAGLSHLGWWSMQRVIEARP